MAAIGVNWKNKKSNKKSTRPNVVVAMKHKAPKPNPFESIWARSKFDILGKKRKGEEKRIGLAHSKAIDKVTRSASLFIYIF